MTRSNIVPVLVEASDESDDVRNLRIILEHAKNGLNEARAKSDPKSERYAMRGMLAGLIDLSEQDQQIKGEGLATPLVELFDALTELDLGRQPAMFEPVKKRGDKRSWAEDDIKGKAAALLEAERKHGAKLKDAGAHIAAILEKFGFPVGGNEVTAKTVMKWRERCMGHHTNEPPEMMLASFKRASNALALRGKPGIEQAYDLLTDRAQRM